MEHARTRIVASWRRPSHGARSAAKPSFPEWPRGARAHGLPPCEPANARRPLRRAPRAGLGGSEPRLRADPTRSGAAPVTAYGTFAFWPPRSRRQSHGTKDTVKICRGLWHCDRDSAPWPLQPNSHIVNLTAGPWRPSCDACIRRSNAPVHCIWLAARPLTLHRFRRRTRSRF